MLPDAGTSVTPVWRAKKAAEIPPAAGTMVIG